MIRKVAVALTVVLAITMVGTLAYRAYQKPGGVVTQVTVAQVGEFFVYMPLYIAESKGFFRGEALEVTIINTGGDEKSVAAVISGNADFGVGDPTFAAIAGIQGQDVKVIASVLNGVPFWGVTKNPKVPEITSPSQLNGFSVATFPAPSTAYTLQSQMFRNGGLQPNIKQAQFGALLPLLDTGAVDIVLELEPNVSTAVAEGARVVYALANTFGDFAMTGVTVSQKTLTEKRGTVERFVRALNRAEAFAHEHPEEAITIAQAKFSMIDPKIAADALRRMLASGTYPKNAIISPEAWQKAIQLRVDAKEIPSVEAAQPFLDSSLAKSIQ